MSAAAASRPTWIGHHAYTFGYIVGEVVRRVTGKPISHVLLEEVSGPLGVADELYFGMPAAEHHRLAKLEDAPAVAGCPTCWALGYGPGVPGPLRGSR